MSKGYLSRDEFGEQEAFVQYLELLQSKGTVEKFTAIPNSTWTPSMTQKMRNKAMGVRAGFPDLIILLKYRAVCIEMKVRGNTPTIDQLSWIGALQEHGILAYVCYGFDGAKQCIDQLILEEKLYPPTDITPDNPS